MWWNADTAALEAADSDIVRVRVSPCLPTLKIKYAGMVELADTEDLKSFAEICVGVQIPLPVPIFSLQLQSIPITSR